MPTYVLKSFCQDFKWKVQAGSKTMYGYKGPIASQSFPYRRWLRCVMSETLNGTLLWKRQLDVNRLTGAITVTVLNAPQFAAVWDNASLTWYAWPQAQNTFEGTTGFLGGDLGWAMANDSVGWHSWYGDTSGQNTYLAASANMYGEAGWEGFENYYGSASVSTTTGSTPTATLTATDDAYVQYGGPSLTRVFKMEFSQEYSLSQLRSDLSLTEDANWLVYSGIETIPIAFDRLEEGSGQVGLSIQKVHFQIRGYNYCQKIYDVPYPALLTSSLESCTTTGDAYGQCKACSGAWIDFVMAAPEWADVGWNGTVSAYMISNHEKEFEINCTACP